MAIPYKIIKVGLLIVVLFISGCADNNVEGVRGGTINGYESTTIGQAFDAVFDNNSWSKSEKADGQVVVEFNGTISEALHDSVVAFIVEEYDALPENNMNRVVLFQQALSGVNDAEYKKLNEEFAHLDPSAGDKRSPKIEQAVFHTIYDRRAWVTGTPVKVQWLIHENGEDFELLAVQSEAWDGVNIDNILGLIYK